MSALEGENILVFEVDGRRLAVPAAELVGVAPLDVFPLPLAEEAHLGLMRYHQSIYPVFDPLRLVRLGRMEGDASLVVFLETSGCALGLACQRVEATAVLKGELEEAEGGTAGWSDGRAVLVLDLEAAVSSRLS